MYMYNIYIYIDISQCFCFAKRPEVIRLPVGLPKVITSHSLRGDFDRDLGWPLVLLCCIEPAACDTVDGCYAEHPLHT